MRNTPCATSLYFRSPSTDPLQEDPQSVILTPPHISPLDACFGNNRVHATVEPSSFKETRDKKTKPAKKTALPSTTQSWAASSASLVGLSDLESRIRQGAFYQHVQEDLIHSIQRCYDLPFDNPSSVSTGTDGLSDLEQRIRLGCSYKHRQQCVTRSLENQGQEAKQEVVQVLEKYVQLAATYANHKLYNHAVMWHASKSEYRRRLEPFLQGTQYPIDLGLLLEEEIEEKHAVFCGFRVTEEERNRLKSAHVSE